EVPAVAPMDLGTGTTLNEIDGILYAAFPKVRGRTLDELDAENRRRIGRTIGRLHAVGAARPATNRPRVSIERSIREPLDVLLSGDFIPGSLAPRYRDVALAIAEKIGAPLAAAGAQRIHGDLHWGNILWAKDGPILVDFDDCLMGPPVQDLWLLARGDTEEARKMRDDLLEGYEVFREFDRSTLALCEPLRAMRIVYMSGWIARRWDDPSFPPAFPNAGGLAIGGAFAIAGAAPFATGTDDGARAAARGAGLGRDAAASAGVGTCDGCANIRVSSRSFVRSWAIRAA